MINGKIDGQDAYFTSDLLEPHPTLPEYWKVYGRSDDQIMHNTGEKVRCISVPTRQHTHSLNIRQTQDLSVRTLMDMGFEPDPNHFKQWTESIMNQDPHVRASVMFGRGRFNTGMIIDVAEPYVFDPNDIDALSKFRNIIWSVVLSWQSHCTLLTETWLLYRPTVERLNRYAPQHSRLFKEVSSSRARSMFTTVRLFI